MLLCTYSFCLLLARRAEDWKEEWKKWTNCVMQEEAEGEVRQNFFFKYMIVKVSLKNRVPSYVCVCVCAFVHEYLECYLPWKG